METVRLTITIIATMLFIMVLIGTVAAVLDGDLIVQAVATEMNREPSPAETLNMVRDGRRGNALGTALAFVGVAGLVGGAFFAVIQYNKSKKEVKREERLAKKAKLGGVVSNTAPPTVLLNVPSAQSPPSTDDVPMVTDIAAGQNSYAQLPSGSN